MRNLLGLVCLAIFTTGCISVHVVPTSRPTAEFSLATENDSQWTTLRTLGVEVFKSEQCEPHEYGVRAGGTTHNDAKASTPPYRILAGEKFVFTARYGDARFAQNRSCGVTGAFVPQVNRKYKALLTVSNDVRSCTLEVFDITSSKEERIDLLLPTYLCTPQGKTAILNGQPQWTNWEVVPGTINVRPTTPVVPSGAGASGSDKLPELQ